MRVYLDACCLNRPFDDQSVDRNRLEAEAVLTVLRRVHRQEWQMVGSDALELELDLTPALDKREFTKGLLAARSSSIVAGSNEVARSQELVILGFKLMDALHLACAESAGCDVLLTTDDRLLKKARAHHSAMHTRVENPLAWIKEQLDQEGNDVEDAKPADEEREE